MSEMMTIQIDFKEDEVFKNIAFVSKSLTSQEINDLPKMAKNLLRKAGVKGNVRLGVIAIYDGYVQPLSFENHKAFKPFEQMLQTEPQKIKDYENKLITAYADPEFVMESVHDEMS